MGQQPGRREKHVGLRSPILDVNVVVFEAVDSHSFQVVVGFHHAVCGLTDSLGCSGPRSPESGFLWRSVLFELLASWAEGWQSGRMRWS